MFDRLFDAISSFGGRILPFAIMDPFEAGVIVRLGIFSRYTRPGLNWRIPFIEVCHYDNVVPRTTDLSPQSLITKDSVGVTLRAITTWRIADVKKALLEVDGIDDVIKDTYYAVIGDTVAKMSFSDLNERSFLTKLRNECQKRAESYGVEVIRVALGELSACRTIRLIQD